MLVGLMVGAVKCWWDGCCLYCFGACVGERWESGVVRVGDVCMGCVVGRSVKLRCYCCDGGMVREFGSFGFSCYLMGGCGLFCFRGGYCF